MSWPPAASPSMTSGRRLARAAYTAAVSPDGPEPTLTTSRGWLNLDILPRSECPAEPADDHEDSPEDQPRRPDGQEDHEDPEHHDRHQQEGGEGEERGEEPEHEHAGTALGRGDGLVA